ncbi:hypothetical protein HF638_25575 [Paenibacillus sp. SZ31]|uniref:hypothetical protein n=1 Tax=Paenibacillus sp. SZ31 TaxID=2725555 RepID=UPI00146D6E49|nr:hypothetical protein [Paenibacillus sp. SZ31]NMI07367.1 hypothetical protein [Paenibacillus sp. SZ31]
MELPVQKEIKSFVTEALSSNRTSNIIGIITNSRFDIKASYSSQLDGYNQIEFKEMLGMIPATAKLKISGGIKLDFLKIFQSTFSLVNGGVSPLALDLKEITGVTPEIAVNWEKEFNPVINYLKPRKKSYKKYKKTKRIIVVEDYLALTRQEQSLLKLIVSYVQSKKINDTIVVIQFIDLKSNESNFSNITSRHFDITEVDLQSVFQKNTNYGEHVVSLTKSLGIDFFQEYREIIIQSNQIELENVEKIIKKIIDETLSTSSDNPDYRKQLDLFLYQCSLFMIQFTKFDIEDGIDPSMLEFIAPAMSAKLIGKTEENKYSFLEVAIRNYFHNEAKNTLQSPVIERIYAYLNKLYPHEYFYLAELQQQFSRNKDDVTSAYIVAYYFSKKEGMETQLNQIVSVMLKNNIGEYYVNKMELVRTNKFQDSTDLDPEITGLFYETKESNLSTLAKLCCYSVLASYLFENEKILNNLYKLYSEISLELQKLNDENCNSVLYWQNEFYINQILLAASFDDPPSLLRGKAIRNSQNQIEHLLRTFKQNSSHKDSNYLKFLRVGNTIYIEDTEKGIKLTEKAYWESKNYPYEYELAKINYSFSLIYLGYYKNANKVLSEKSSFDLNIINKDTYLSYHNNYTIAQILSGKITHKKAMKKFENLLNQIDSKDSSDATIIKNNMAAAQLDIQRETALQSLDSIVNDPDHYHSFYAFHNILYLYFKERNLKLFDSFYKSDWQRKFPKLLKPYFKFFNNKFSAMRILLVQDLQFSEMVELLYNELNSKYPEKTYTHYKKLILFGGIERWFE